MTKATEIRRTPLWKSIADALRNAIADGQYAPGDKLPTEASLAERFGVNRHTVRHAVSRLSAEGLVHSRRGAGVFVLSRPVDYPLGARVRFHQSLLAAGHLPEKRVLAIEARPATAQEAKRLQMSEGDALCAYHALSYVDSSPVALVESHFPEARLPGLARTLNSEPSITRALERCGVPDYTRVSTRLSARIATATQANHLRVDEGAPLLFSSAINADPVGTPVEFGQTWFVSDRITLTLGEL